MIGSSKFTLELLQAISDWQRGGSILQKEKRGKKIKELAIMLDPSFRIVSEKCYRQISLKKMYVWEMAEKLSLLETISSWTLDFEIAKDFKGGVPGRFQDDIGAIFSIDPKPENVIINLNKLYEDPHFISSCNDFKSEIVGYSTGIDRYRGEQKEVILEIHNLPIETIYSIGGHSSSKENLAKMFFRHTPNKFELAFFEYLLRTTGADKKIGPNWLTGAAKDRTISKWLYFQKHLSPFHRSRLQLEVRNNIDIQNPGTW
ncbi:hypothetical protein [Larkinella sp.]|uniref:hypothetical protein n=1 Tax=Larkinella sp. TaxID=2034517 RepID=UPI003BAAC9AA